MHTRRITLGAGALLSVGALAVGCSASPAAPQEPAEAPTGEITFWSSLSGHCSR